MHEVRGCTSGVARASGSPHQLSITRLSVHSITAGQRTLQTPDAVQAAMTGHSIVHQQGSKPTAFPAMG
jgi:hypothetical protein